MVLLCFALLSYTGSDISVLVRDALMQPVRKVLSATHFKKVMAPLKPKEGEAQPDSSIMKEYLTPCSPGDPDAKEMTWETIDGGDLLEPPLVMNDFIRAIQIVRPTVTEVDLKQHNDFTADNGLE